MRLGKSNQKQLVIEHSGSKKLRWLKRTKLIKVIKLCLNTKV